MEHPSNGRGNFAVSEFCDLLKTVDEVYSIDEKIENLTQEVRNLRSRRLKKKKVFAKAVNRFKRNYNATISECFVQGASKYLSDMNSSYFFKSPTLTCLNKKLSSPSECRTKRATTMRERMLAKKELDEIGNYEGEEGNERPDFPIWDDKSPDAIRVYSKGFTNERTFKVYVPANPRNPFSDFMRMVQ